VTTGQALRDAGIRQEILALTRAGMVGFGQVLPL
jgi:hypothetical protein